jgi:hypothetical protein
MTLSIVKNAPGTFLPQTAQFPDEALEVILAPLEYILKLHITGFYNNSEQ